MSCLLPRCSRRRRRKNPQVPIPRNQSVQPRKSLLQKNAARFRHGECNECDKHLSRQPRFVRWRSNCCRSHSGGLRRVEAFAKKHANEDAGSLAWLVLGYAHTLDRDFTKAIDPLARARANAGDLADYVTYYLGNAYLQSGRSADAITTLVDFEKNIRNRCWAATRPSFMEPRYLRKTAARTRSRFWKKIESQFAAIWSWRWGVPTLLRRKLIRLRLHSRPCTTKCRPVRKAMPPEQNCANWELSR